MEQNITLEHDILLYQRNTHAKNARIHETVTYVADTRVIRHRTHLMRKRLWGLLPLKVTENIRESQPIPPEITTEQQLRDYIRKHGICRL